MTNGLLISRAKKNELHTVSLNNPSIVNIEKYKTYRNMFNKLTRAMKQLYYEQNIAKNIKNPKKTWEILKEISTGVKNNSKIEKIKARGKTLTDKSEISNEFNTFSLGLVRKLAILLYLLLELLNPT